MITWQHSDRYKIFTLTTCFFWRFVVTRGVTFGFWQIKLLGTDWAIFLSTLQLLTNCETCIGSSSSLLWNVHKYHFVILKHGWTCGEGGFLWPSNRLHCPLCLWASTCKHSLVCQQCWTLAQLPGSHEFIMPSECLQALTVHYQSYVNSIKLVLAVDDAQFPDSHQLLDDFAESLRLIRQAASTRWPKETLPIFFLNRM